MHPLQSPLMPARLRKRRSAHPCGPQRTRVRPATGRVLTATLPFLCTGTAVAEERGYTNNTYGFTLAVPDEWVEIPSQYIQSMRDLLLNQEGKKDIDYVAGFQRRGTFDWFAYPYVLVQVTAYDSLPNKRPPCEDEFDDIMKELAGLDVGQETADALNDEFKDLAESTNLRGFNLDSARRRFSFEIAPMTPREGLVIRGRSFGFIGGAAIVYVHFYDRLENWDASNHERAAFKNAFAFLPGHEYSAQQASSVRFKKRYAPLIQGAVAGGITAFIAVWVAKRKKKKEQAA